MLLSCDNPVIHPINCLNVVTDLGVGKAFNDFILRGFGLISPARTVIIH